MYTRAQKGQLRVMEEAMKFDDFVPAVTSIDSRHRSVHDGQFFHCTYRQASLANGANEDILVVAPAGCYPHLQGMFLTAADSPCDVKNYKGVTTSADGTQISAFNRNLNSSNTPALEVYYGPTVTDLGTLYHDRFVPDQGGQGSNQIGLITPDLNEEWVLAPSQKYLTRITNNSGGAIIVTFELLWYEPNYNKVG